MWQIAAWGEAPNLEPCARTVTPPNAASLYKGSGVTIAVTALNGAAHVTKLIVHDQALLHQSAADVLMMDVNHAVSTRSAAIAVRHTSLIARRLRF